MNLRKLPLYLVMFVLLGLFLSGCGPSTVNVSLTSYNITPDKSSVGSGDVTFHITNDATDLTHEFVVFKTDLAEDALPLNDEGIVDEEGAGDALTLIDEVEDIEPGMTVDLTVTLDPGNYVLICNIDSDELHYQHGMHTAFTVK